MLLCLLKNCSSLKGETFCTNFLLLVRICSETKERKINPPTFYNTAFRFPGNNFSLQSFHWKLQQKIFIKQNTGKKKKKQPLFSELSISEKSFGFCAILEQLCFYILKFYLKMENLALSRPLPLCLGCLSYTFRSQMCVSFNVYQQLNCGWRKDSCRSRGQPIVSVVKSQPLEVFFFAQVY